MLAFDPNGLQYKRHTINPGKCFPIFVLNSPSDDVPLIVDGGYMKNAYINSVAHIQEQMNFLHPKTEVSSGAPTLPTQFQIGTAFLTPIFEIGIMPINTLRLLSDVATDVVVETYQGGYIEMPTYPVDVLKTKYVLTNTTTISSATNWADVLVLPALPRVYFKITVNTYIAGSNLMLYLHSEISM